MAAPPSPLVAVACDNAVPGVPAKMLTVDDERVSLRTMYDDVSLKYSVPAELPHTYLGMLKVAAVAVVPEVEHVPAP